MAEERTFVSGGHARCLEGKAFPFVSAVASTDGYPPTGSVRHNQRLIQSFIRAFLAKNLKGQKASLLDEPSRAHPEATVQRYGSK